MTSLDLVLDDPAARGVPATSRRTRVVDGAVAVAAVVGVATVATLFAHVFRATGVALLERVGGTSDPTSVAAGSPRLVVAGVVAAAAAGAVWLAHVLARRRPGRTGLTELVEGDEDGGAARGSLRATLTRAAGTWLASVSMLSVGRESAILETGAAVGSTVERRLRAAPGTLVATGVAAAFATAYHAPFAALLYAEEHLGVRRRPRVVAAVVGAVGVSQGLVVLLIGRHTIFPGHRGSYLAALGLGLVGAVPAALAARAFLRLRERAALAARDRAPSRRRLVVLVTATAALVALVPLVAGNGMEALRVAADHPTLTVAAALVLAKLLATSTALAAGVPGGAFSPTMAVAGGAALAGYLALEWAGAPMPAELWDGMLLAMAVGLAVGLEAPLTAVVVVPEMAGDPALLPLTAVVVGLGAGFVWALDRVGGRHRRPRLHDEDA